MARLLTPLFRFHIGHHIRRAGWSGLLAISALATPLRAAPRSDPSEAAVVAVPATGTLSERVDALLGSELLAGCEVGVAAIDLATGKTIYRRGDQLALNPASNVKLVTTAAALALLGPEYRYSTRVFVDKGATSGDILRGELYLVGSGDPSLVTGDLFELANDLKGIGVSRISGGITVDGSRFDRDELPPGYDQKNELASYRAPSGAMSVNFNTFVVRVRPGSAVGRPAIATIDPPVPGIALVHSASTIEGRARRLNIGVEALEEGRVRVTVSGALGVDAGPAQFRYPVTDPSRYAGEVFQWVLASRGITVRRKQVRLGAPPQGAELVAIHWSESLAVLTRAINKLSNNFMAEQVLKTLAGVDEPATFTGAMQRVRDWLDKIGIRGDGLRYGNGSGLYDTNRFSAAQLTRLLARVYHDFRIGPDFLASLAIMGADGTTRKRLETSTAKRFVRAKTGTLDGVSALSGYAGAVGRPPVAFAILMNRLEPAQAPYAREIQNLVAELLAAWAAEHPVETKRTKKK